MSGIEWPSAPTSSGMIVDVPDNYPTPPAGPPVLLVASLPCNVNISWTVPSPYSTTLGGTFQLRSYVESIGPGQELQIGPTIIVPVVPGTTAYNATITVPGGTLLGEGQIYNGVPVSGVYEIVAVLQHLNPAPTVVSGYAEDTLKMFRSP